MLHLYNTLTSSKEAFHPVKTGEVSIYSCGPTVYNYVHIGNIRAIIFYDTLQRWIRFGEKLETKWVMNITDVDDKTIRDSSALYPEMESLSALKKFTQYYADLFFTDIEEVGVDRSHFLSVPYATEYIEEMKDLIQKIVDNGYAYIVDGSVYLDVQKYRKDYEYGRLVTLNFDEMLSTDRVENDEYEKSNVSDFVLWKGKKEGEPFWDFSLSVSGETVETPGRPGWHIECSAMSKSLFPDFPFDIHTGGIDLCFPHHEDEICQAQAGYGEDTARFWVHNEHLMVEGKKMSKSLGNFYTLNDLKEKGFDGDSIRFFLVTNNYRKKINLSEESLKSAEKMLQRMRGFIAHFLKNDENASAITEDDCEVFISDFTVAMQDDLNTPVAVAKVFEFFKKLSHSQCSGSVRQQVVTCVELVESVFGISFQPVIQSFSAEVLALISQRDEARLKKDWALSDAIRSQLQELGYSVSDVDGKTVVE